MNFFQVTGLSLHPDTYLEVGCADGRDDSDKVKTPQR